MNAVDRNVPDLRADVDAALSMYKASASALRTVQPQIDTARLKCLMIGYQHLEIYVDLWGHADDSNGCIVEGIAWMGTTDDATCLFDGAAIRNMENAVDRQGEINDEQKRQLKRAGKSLAYLD